VEVEACSRFVWANSVAVCSAIVVLEGPNHDKVTESLRRNENETKTKTIYPAVIGRTGRTKKQLSCLSMTAGYIDRFRLRFLTVFVSFRFAADFLSLHTGSVQASSGLYKLDFCQFWRFFWRLFD